MTKPVVTQKEALEIAKQVKLKLAMQSISISNRYPARTLFIADEEDLANFANAVIAAKFGEPVAEIELRNGDTRCMYWHTYLQQLPAGTELYALKKPTDKEQS